MRSLLRVDRAGRRADNVATATFLIPRLMLPLTVPQRTQEQSILGSPARPG